MPTQKRKLAGNEPISFRPGALQKSRLDELAKHRQQNQSTVLNAAIDLLWLFDIGFVNFDEMRQADVLTSYGENDVTAG